MKRTTFSIPPVTEEIMGTIRQLCDIAGYGIHSGIRAGETGDTAARYNNYQYFDSQV